MARVRIKLARIQARKSDAQVLIDSDVLVWLTRGHAQAAARLSQISPWKISAVTYIELAQGCRSKAELARLKRGLALRQTEVLQVTPTTSARAMALIDEFALSHGMRLADALIAATAIEHQLSLLTGNAKHFEHVEQLKVERFAM